MSKFESSVDVVLCVGAALFATLFGIKSMSEYQDKRLEADKLRSMPDSYWEARKAEAAASVKKHEMDIASKERLTLDKRNREAEEAAAQREFEKTAPPEYWASLARQVEAEERGRTDRENAQAQAKALEKAAYEIRRAAIGY